MSRVSSKQLRYIAGLVDFLSKNGELAHNEEIEMGHFDVYDKEGNVISTVKCDAGDFYIESYQG